jgi:hypothetical protein
MRELFQGEPPIQYKEMQPCRREIFELMKSNLAWSLVRKISAVFNIV